MRRLLACAMLLTCAAAIPGQGPGQLFWASQSTDSATVTPANSVSCNTGATPPQYHVANSYIRNYDMFNSGVISSAEICKVRFGVEYALAGLAAGSQPAEIRLYVVPNAGFTFPVSLATLPVAHTEIFTVADVPPTSPNTVIEKSLSTPVLVQPTDNVVVEFFTPDGIGLQNVLFVGSNPLGESGPSYLMAPGCGATLPTLISALVPTLQMHIILDLGYRWAGSPLTLTLGSPVAGDLRVDLDGLYPGREYYTVYSLVPCPVQGGGPYLGLCENDVNNLIALLLLPPVIFPVHFIATECCQGITFNGLPAGLWLDAVSFDWTGGVLGQFTPVQRIQIN